MNRASPAAVIVCVAALLTVTAACELPAVELRGLSSENACFADEDCCVVVDSCAAEAYVVSAEEFDAARDLADDTSQCADCVIPPVTVECVDGQCLGKAFNPADVRYADGQAPDGCGARSVETVVDEPAANADLIFVVLDDGVASCGTVPVD